MFQPFHEMKNQVILKFKQAGKRYLVTQTYERGRNDLMQAGKEPILMSHYDDPGLAQIHYNAIPEGDKYRFILDLENENHLLRIQEMLHPKSRYIVYAKLVFYKQDELEEYLKKRYFDKVSRFIAAKTNWHLGKNKFATHLQIIFGELYLEIRLHNERIRVKFEEIENS